MSHDSSLLQSVNFSLSVLAMDDWRDVFFQRAGRWTAFMMWYFFWAVARLVVGSAAQGKREPARNSEPRHGDDGSGTKDSLTIASEGGSVGRHATHSSAEMLD